MRVQDNCLRSSLAPGLLSALSLNHGRHGRELRLFEVGRVYAWPSAGEAPFVVGDPGPQDARLPSERLCAALVRMGEARPLRTKAEVDDSVHALVLDVRRLCARLGLTVDVCAAAEPCSFLHPGVQSQLVVRVEDRDVTVGMVGQIHPERLDALNLPMTDRAAYAELDLQAVLPLLSEPRAQATPRFPATARDVSLLLPADLSVQTCMRAMEQAGRDVADGADPTQIRLLAGDRGSQAVDVVEVYQALDMAPGARAVLFRLYYRAQDRSIKDTEAQSLHERILKTATAALERQGHAVEVR